MKYNILKASLHFGNGELLKVAVLVEVSEGDIRAIEATRRPRAGYFFLPPGAVVNDELLQRVAAQGMEVNEWEGAI